MAALEVSGLRKAYGDTVAVADLSFDAAPAAVTAILGRNGAGKTTTVEVCCGLRTPDSGRVSVLGHEPAHPSLRARVGVMPQAGGSGAAGVYPSARAGEVLALFAAMYADPLPAQPLLARLGLDGVVRTPWRRLSGGEQQRLSLALALVGRPELVFLDEPTAGLDVHGRLATWDLVRSLREAGVAVVLTTHAMDEAEQLADAVVIVDGGQVVATGSPAELTASGPAGGLSFDAPAGLPVDDLAAALPSRRVVTEPTPGHYVVAGPVDPATVAAVAAWCAARDVLPQRLTTGARSLEDVFLELTGRPGQ